MRFFSAIARQPSNTFAISFIIFERVVALVTYLPMLSNSIEQIRSVGHGNLFIPPIGRLAGVQFVPSSAHSQNTSNIQRRLHGHSYTESVNNQDFVKFVHNHIVLEKLTTTNVAFGAYIQDSHAPL